MDQHVARTYKLQEFHAHQENVNDVCFGHRSCRVLATGSDDFTVKVWKLGRKQPLLNLTGHTTEVDCVLFDPLEEVMAGASRGGTIKLWDLAHQKALRTLGGHRASVCCLDFHPYGDFFVSGSLDTNLKVWDIRKKGVLQTFNGHKASVTAVKHSPDGRWIVSGDAHGIIKIWDLTAGREVQELRISKSTVNAEVRSLTFHPAEFLLAVGSTSRSTSFWDLESFQLVSTSNDTSAISQVLFSSSGEGCLSASDDSLRVLGWEPPMIFDHVDTRWGALDDMAVTNDNNLLGVSHLGTVVCVNVVELSTLKPFSNQAAASSSSSSQASSIHRRANTRDESDGSTIEVRVRPKAHAQFATKTMKKNQFPMNVDSAVPTSEVPVRPSEPSVQSRDHGKAKSSKEDSNQSAAYSFFVADNEPLVRKTHGDKSDTEVQELLLMMWQLATLDAKAPYLRMARETRKAAAVASRSEESRNKAPTQTSTTVVMKKSKRGVGNDAPRSSSRRKGNRESSPPPQAVGFAKVWSDSPQPRSPPQPKAALTHSSPQSKSTASSSVVPTPVVPTHRGVEVKSHKVQSSSPQGDHVQNHRLQQVSPTVTAGAVVSDNVNNTRVSESGVGGSSTGITNGVLTAKPDPKYNVFGAKPSSPPRAEKSVVRPQPSSHVEEPQPRPIVMAPPSKSRRPLDPRNDTLKLIDVKGEAGPIGLNVSQFLQNKTPPVDLASEDEEVRRKMMSDHPTMCGILTTRLNNLVVLRGLWNSGDVYGCIKTLVLMRDNPTTVDFLSNTQVPIGKCITLSMSMELMPVINEFLSSQFEVYVRCSLTYLQLILNAFSETIRNTRAALQLATNPSLEDRRTKCDSIFNSMKDAHARIDRVAKKKNGVGPFAREVKMLMEQLLHAQ